MTLIDGKAISEQVKQEIAAEVAEIVARGGKRPHLAAILVGHDGGSETYVAAKVKACEVCGFKSSLIRYESDVTEEELLAKVRELNEDRRRRRIYRTTPVTQTYLRTESYRNDRLPQRRRRIPPYQCRTYVYRTSVLCIRHSRTVSSNC